ncbi:MAG: sulfate transporter CysZ [Gammaproteobacteria bacterium]|nr:sulfate transporter CysZ [Gammaproteobacteria bacterium]MBQ0838471.1 sulfate transporter CysZ [Gammaproteobacteria bacterium]
MGLTHFIKGFKLLAAPGIRLWVIIPLLLNLALFVGLTLYAMQQFEDLMGWMLNYLPSWLEFIAWLFRILFGLLLAICYAYTFTLIGNLIASPFYGLLANAVYIKLSGKEDEAPLTFKTASVIAWQAFVREVQKMAYFLPRLVGVLLICLILSFIPLINFAVPAIAFLWGAWSLALQYLDYPADINCVNFKTVRQRAGRVKALSLSFGSIVLLGSSIPLLNLLVMPAAVAGATSLWLEQFKDK